MNPNDDNYIPMVCPSIHAIQSSVSGVYPSRRFGCELVFENAAAYIFACAFYTRWGWHSVNTRLVGKFWEKLKCEHDLDHLRDIYILGSRGWLLTNPYNNTTRLTVSAIVKVLSEEPVYIGGLLD